MVLCVGQYEMQLSMQNKSIYMKAAQQRLQARDSDHPGDTIPGGTKRGVDVMEPASAGILQSSGSVDIQVCLVGAATES